LKEFFLISIEALRGARSYRDKKRGASIGFGLDGSLTESFLQQPQLGATTTALRCSCSIRCDEPVEARRHAVDGIPRLHFVDPGPVADGHQAAHAGYPTFFRTDFRSQDHGVVLEVAVMNGVKARTPLPRATRNRLEARRPQGLLRVGFGAVGGVARFLS